MEVTRQNNTQLVSSPTDLTVRLSVCWSVCVGVAVFMICSRLLSVVSFMDKPVCVDLELGNCCVQRGSVPLAYAATSSPCRLSTSLLSAHPYTTLSQPSHNLKSYPNLKLFNE